MEGHSTSYSSLKEDIVLEVEDIDRNWAYSLSEELDDFRLMQMSSKSFTISRVPPDVRKGKEKYYNPSLLSIGPYHRDRKELQSMEVHKLKYLKDFLARNTNNTLEDYISMLRKVEDEARKCYFDYIPLTSEEFVKMLLLDGCFLIELILKNNLRSEDENGILEVSWFLGRVLTDMLLLENQIPFFVISRLFQLLVKNIQPTNEKERSISDLKIVRLFGDLFTDSEIKVKKDDVNHLLSLRYSIGLQDDDAGIEGAAKTKSTILSSFFKLGVALLSNLLKPLLWIALLCIHCILSPKGKHASLTEGTRISCASKLDEYGVKFKTKLNKKYRLKNISFNDGVLEIPEMVIDEGTKNLAFNLLAFEQCNLTSRQELSSYWRFMDFLIDTSVDVEILEDSGIIVSHLKSSKDTATFFNELNDLYDEFSADNEHLLEVFKEINTFCNSKWHRYRAKLKRDYFSNPWSILSLIAAVILLILTLVQTFVSVYGYIKPPS